MAQGIILWARCSSPGTISGNPLCLGIGFVFDPPELGLAECENGVLCGANKAGLMPNVGPPATGNPATAAVLVKLTNASQVALPLALVFTKSLNRGFSSL